MRVQWYRAKKNVRKPQGGFLSIGPRYPGEIVGGGTVVCFAHHGASEWIEIVPFEHLEEVEKDPPLRRRWK